MAVLIGLWFAPAAAMADLSLWRSLDALQGTWRGVEDGMAGAGDAVRCGSTRLGGRVQFARARSDIEPQPGPSVPQAEGRFDRMQFITRDPDTGRITLTEFDSTGGRRLFELRVETSQADRFEFRNEDQDRPQARQQRLVFELQRGERMRETLFLAAANGEMLQARTHRWARTEGVDTRCDP